MLNVCAQRLANTLQDKDLNYQTDIANDGTSVILFPFQGKVVRMFFSGENGKYLSMYLVFERVPDEKVTDVILKCNELNCQYKWFSFYVDKDKDITLQNDAILTESTAADVALELLVRMVKISDEVKPAIMKAIYA